jgi:predicted regulator of Ras-like GTPase activity (Roadblock/LC7/MglB family)
MLEPSLDIYGATYEQVDVVLADLLVKSHARYALIVDRSGFVLMHQRAVWAPKPPSLDSLATLIASNYSANAAIAKLFGENGFRESVQQGADVGTYVEELGDKALLVSVFDASAPLGKVKLFTKHAGVRIRDLLAGVDEAPPVFQADQAWRDDTGALLDGLFSDRTTP